MNFRKRGGVAAPKWLGIVALCALCSVAVAQAAEQQALADASRVSFSWGVKIPMRDGIALNATVYLPKN